MSAQQAIGTHRGSQPVAPAAGDILTMGALLFAPVLLIFPLSILGEA